jgi:hypothetical protein
MTGTENATESEALMALYRFLRHPVQAGPVWVKYKRQGVDSALFVVEDLMNLHGFCFTPANEQDGST